MKGILLISTLYKKWKEYLLTAWEMAKKVNIYIACFSRPDTCYGFLSELKFKLMIIYQKKFSTK